MEAKVKELCDRIVTDRKALRKKMIWETDSNSTAIMSAFMFASAGQDVDVDKYVKCKKILNKKVSIFNEFRGIAFTMVVTKMALSEDPEKYVDGALEVYKKLREKHKFTASANMVMAALTLYEYGGVEKADENIKKLETLYEDLKKKHPVLTSDDDRGYLAMVIASGADPYGVAEEIDACYEANKKLTLNRNAVLSLSEVLALSDKSTQQKALEVKAMVDGFKEAKKRVSKEYGLPALGGLVLMDVPVDKLVPEIAEIDEYMKHQSGFRWFSVDPQVRRMYCQMIYMLTYFNDSNSVLTSIMASTMAMVIMQEIIMMIMVNNAILMSNTSNSSN